KATDAITKLRLELSRLTALDNILGNTPDQAQVLERRVGTLTTGLKTLVDAGVSTSSRAFRSFATDLVNTSQALEKLRGGDGKEFNLKPVNVKSLIPTTIGDTLPQDVARLLGDYAKQAKPDDLRNQVALYDINRAATDALTSGLSGLANGLLESIGQLATGSIGLEQFGATILGLVGKLATQLGEAIIAVGI
nr:hypothetical protein [Tanacetum cinerariifolium]